MIQIKVTQTIIRTMIHVVVYYKKKINVQNTQYTNTIKVTLQKQYYVKFAMRTVLSTLDPYLLCSQANNKM